MELDIATTIGKRIAEHASHFASIADRGSVIHMGGNPQTAKVIDDWGMGDKWYVFGGHCMETAIIRAENFASAYDIYLDECAGPSETPDSTKDEAHGTYTSTGKWFSECTTSYIMHLKRIDSARVEFIAD